VLGVGEAFNPLTGIQLLGSGAKMVPLNIYELHNIALNHETIELKRSMELST
jgi:hypothetical protein